MYILKNSIISIVRNKGRNILIGVIILVIACASTVTLSIRNTANNLVKAYEESHDIIATLSFDRQKLMSNFQGGADAQRSNIEAFNNIEQISLEDVKKYGESEYLKSYYYLYSTSLNSDSLSKATDTYEYEVEDKQTITSSTSTTTTTGGNNGPGGPGGFGGGNYAERHTTVNNNTTTVITRSRATFGSSNALTGDFELDGYSSYDAMTNFVNGTYKIVDGEIISDFDNFECVVSEELATLNEKAVGEIITLKNPNTETTYDFIIKGIYKDNTDSDNSSSMYSQSVNTIITGSKVVEKLTQDDNDLVTNVTPSFILLNDEVIDKFTEEVKEKGLSEYYTINTNLDELKNATKSIENVKTFATTFLLITLIISGVVLFVINMINIRERKYEIGVFRTIGMSKLKLTIQFLLELLIVAIIMLCIGAVIGGALSKPVGNMLLQNEIEANEQEKKDVSNNFGRRNMNFNYQNENAEIKPITEIDAVVDVTVVLQLLGIGVFLTLISSLASMISIQRFSPLTILKERS